MITPIIGAVANVATSLYTAEQNRSAQAQNNRIIREREDTAIQRAVRDSKQAGLNPISSNTPPQAPVTKTDAPQLGAEVAQSTGTLAEVLTSASIARNRMDADVESQRENMALSWYQNQITDTTNEQNKLIDKLVEIENERKTAISSLTENQQAFQNSATNTIKELEQSLSERTLTSEQIDFIKRMGSDSTSENTSHSDSSQWSVNGDVNFDFSKFNLISTGTDLLDSVLDKAKDIVGHTESHESKSITDVKDILHDEHDKFSDSYEKSRYKDHVEQVPDYKRSVRGEEPVWRDKHTYQEYPYEDGRSWSHKDNKIDRKETNMGSRDIVGHGNDKRKENSNEHHKQEHTTTQNQTQKRKGLGISASGGYASQTSDSNDKGVSSTNGYEIHQEDRFTDEERKQFQRGKERLISLCAMAHTSKKLNFHVSTVDKQTFERYNTLYLMYHQRYMQNRDYQVRLRSNPREFIDRTKGFFSKMRYSHFF